ncbi:hypothetical protein ACFL5Z_03960 [Planctomycetota bacterium]
MKTNRISAILFLGLNLGLTISALGKLPPGWMSEDIGGPALPGSSRYDPNEESFTITGGGLDIWDTWDQFHFVYKCLPGDFMITARVLNIQKTYESSKVGVMIRDDLTGSSKHAMMVLTQENNIAFHWRSETGGITFLSVGPRATTPYWFRLVRQGDTFKGYHSSDGINWMLQDSVAIPIDPWGKIYIGLSVCSQNSEEFCTAQFTNVTITDEVDQNPSDLNWNGIIDYSDIVIFADAWLSEKGTENWSAMCDLFIDEQINFQDWTELAGNWLWRAQEPITEDTASAIATEFAQFRKVNTVHHTRSVSRHTQAFDVLGYDGQGDILVGVDRSKGEVIRMVKQCPYPGRDSENVVISREQAVQEAENFLVTHGLPSIPKNFRIDSAKLVTTWRKKHWEIIWLHYENGVQVLPDFILFVVNPETGDVVSYSKVHHVGKITHIPKLSEGQAINLARAVLGKGKLAHYDPQMSVLKATLTILYPNNYFTDFTWHWTAHQTLSWVVQFEVNGESAIDIWIDAPSGDLLGGEIYERPVPELWGIPDQETDVTGIWKPALEKMQFDTKNTFLGNANEKQVIDSIKNGEYFIFHSHGTTDTIAEFAKLSFFDKGMGGTDEQRLTPDEIPNNNLRYALMSCCHSGDDGWGDDFKDVFIQKGADVFQGYEKQIQPDWYEDELLYYLAQGQSLWNAHWNAVAKAKPPFKIVIEYDPAISCFNKLRLAPLHVDASGPKTTNSATATIKVTVHNREDVRKTTATNVRAELKVPAGFMLIEGMNPQATASLSWDQKWACQWTVQKTDLQPGIGYFDVVVWSDNLGIAVDNPYKMYRSHAVTVNFNP